MVLLIFDGSEDGFFGLVRVLFMALYKWNRAAYLLYVNGKRVMHFIGLNFSLNPKIVTWSTYGLFRTVNIEFIKQRG